MYCGEISNAGLRACIFASLAADLSCVTLRAYRLQTCLVHKAISEILKQYQFIKRSNNRSMLEDLGRSCPQLNRKKERKKVQHHALASVSFFLKYPHLINYYIINHESVKKSLKQQIFVFLAIFLFLKQLRKLWPLFTSR